MKHKVVVMAGGKGERLRPLTFTRPKPLLPIVNKPTLQHIVEKLRDFGCREFIFTLGYLSNRIKEYFRRHCKGEKDTLIKFVEESKPLGTAGGVKNVAEFIDSTFIVWSGDVLASLDIKDMLKFHRKCGGIGTIAFTRVEDPREYGIAEVDDSYRIVRYIEKPKTNIFSNLANCGIYIFEPEIFDFIEDGDDFSRDVFPRILNNSHDLYAYSDVTYWNDIGRPHTYKKANKDVLYGKVKLKISERKKGDIWIGHDCVVENSKIKGRSLIGIGCSIESSEISQCVVGRNAKIRNSVIENSIIFGNVKIDGAKIVNCIIGDSCIIKRNNVLRNAIVGDNCKFLDGRVIENISIKPHTII